MKLQTKKILSIFAIISVTISNSHVFGYYDGYSSNKKIKKLAKLNNSLVSVIDNDIKKSIVKIKNIQDKKLFNQELLVLKENGKNISEDIEDSYDYNYGNLLDKLKIQARAYKTLKTDIDNYNKNGINVYNISQDAPGVEKEIILMQSYYIGIIKDSLDKFLNSDGVKQSGSETFEINSNIAKLKVTTHKYANILSFITGSQELDYKVDINFSIFKDEKMRIENDINGNLSFDINMKIIDNDIYLTIKDYSVDFGDSKEEAILESKTYLESFLSALKGKVLRIPSKYNNPDFKFNYAEQIRVFKEILNLLEKESILTPYKKNTNGVYLLTPKTSTLQKIGTIIDSNYTSNDALKIRIGLMKNPINYSYNNGNPKIFITFKSSTETGKVELAKKGKDYGITLDFINKYSSFYTYLQKDLYKLNIKSDDIVINGSLENKELKFNLETQGFKFETQGTTDKDNTDVKFLINSKESGYLKINKDNTDNIKYSFYLKLLDLNKLIPGNPDELEGKFMEIKIDGDYLLETGNFEINKPDSYIEVDELKNILETKKESLY